MKGFIATLLLLLTSVVNADEAKLVVEGPDKVSPGKLVVLSVEKSNAKSFKWLVHPQTDNFLVIEGGKRVVFSSGVPGEYHFTVAGALGDTCDVSVHTIIVAGGIPQVKVNTFQMKVNSWCDQVESQYKRDECLALAQSFSSVALVMEGGTLTTPAEIIKATYKSNQDALGESLEDWLPFRNGLGKELSSMAKQGKLSDTAAHIKVWKTIATALREYASQL